MKNPTIPNIQHENASHLPEKVIIIPMFIGSIKTSRAMQVLLILPSHILRMKNHIDCKRRDTIAHSNVCMCIHITRNETARRTFNFPDKSSEISIFIQHVILKVRALQSSANEPANVARTISRVDDRAAPRNSIITVSLSIARSSSNRLNKHSYRCLSERKGR